MCFLTDWCNYRKSLPFQSVPTKGFLFVLLPQYSNSKQPETAKCQPHWKAKLFWVALPILFNGEVRHFHRLFLWLKLKFANFCNVIIVWNCHSKHTLRNDHMCSECIENCQCFAPGSWIASLVQAISLCLYLGQRGSLICLNFCFSFRKL